MRRKGQGSASISAVVVFLSALLAIGLMATILPPVANVLSGFREGLRERGERGSELIRIYIHTANETELEPPIITIINGYDRESILTDYVVVAKDGRVLAAGKMGGSLNGVRIPAGARIDMTPADFGLSYGTFAAMADEVKAIYIRTAEGNSFGSSYGPPPKINPDYQLSISQRSQHILVFGSTTTIYNITISGNFTLPTTSYAIVVKNVILVDPSGFVRGGVTAGKKWSDGSFNPNKIPDQLVAFTQTQDAIPIGGYYIIPPFPSGCFSVYSSSDTCPSYIEMVEFHPVEYYMPGSPVTAVPYYLQHPGEVQTVYNPDLGRMVTITAQRPVSDLNYPYGIPGVYTNTITFTYISSGSAVTGTYTSTVTVTGTVWEEDGQIKMAPLFNPFLSGLDIIIIRTITTTSTSCWLWCNAIVRTYTTTRTVSAGNLSGGWVTATAVIPIGSITTQTITSPSTYTTTYAVGTSGNFRDQIKNAVVNGTLSLSGDAVAHLAGTVQGGQIVKIKAPIVLLNYIYRTGNPPNSPPPPPPPPPPPSYGSTSGGGRVDETTMVCKTQRTSQPAGDSSSGASPVVSERPLLSGSGGTKPDYIVREVEVLEVHRVICSLVPALG
jgi:hypothetical protein